MSQRAPNHYNGPPRLHKRATKVAVSAIAEAVASVKTSSTTKASAATSSAVRVASTSAKAPSKSSTTVGTAPPNHKTSTSAANADAYSSYSFAAQASSAAPLVATVSITSTIQPKSTAGSSTATTTSHVTFTQSALIGTIVGALGACVLVLFAVWLCRRVRTKKAEGEWRRLNASQDGLGTAMVGGKTVRVMGGKPIGAAEGEAKWGQREDGEKSPLPSPTGASPMLGYQMGAPVVGAQDGGAGTKAQYTFAAISRDPAKMAAARDELLARGGSGKNPSHLRVNTALARTMSSKSKPTSPMNISAPLPSPTPSESFIVRPPPSPFGDEQMAEDVYPPPPAATIVPTTVGPVDSWADQAATFPVPRPQVRPETIISLGSTQAGDESYRHPSKDQLINNIDHQSLAKRRQSSAIPRRKQDTVFATIESYSGDPTVNGWRPESSFARPQTMFSRTSPPRTKRSSSVGRLGGASTREVVDAFPAPPPMPTGLGLSSPTEGQMDHPLAVPQPAAVPGLDNFANTAPLRLARARSGKVPSPIMVPTLSVDGMQPAIASAPPVPGSDGARPPLASPAVTQNRRQSMAAPLLARQSSKDAAPEMPRPSRSASMRQPSGRAPASPTPPAIPLPVPPPMVAAPSPRTKPAEYGSPTEQYALAALTHRSPKLASSPADASSPEFDAGTPASTQDSAFGAPTTPGSSAPATPRDFDPRFDGETLSERREAERGAKVGLGVEAEARATLFPPMEGDKLNGRTYNNDRTVSIYDMY